MEQMWIRLMAYTIGADGNERAVNHQNEWGGYSHLLQMPVFTAFAHLCTFNRENQTTRALVCDVTWNNRNGINNQERWLRYAEQQTPPEAAFFLVHAVDTNAAVMAIDQIEDHRVFVGAITREGGRTYITGRPRPLPNQPPS